MSEPFNMMISGTWQNLNTGDVFIVKDSMMDESGNPFVSTTDGRTISAGVLQDYVQISDTALPQAEIEQIKREMAIVNQEDILSKPISNPNYRYQENIYKEEPAPVPQNNNFSIIEKAFRDKVEAPGVTLHWDKFPEKQIQLLTEIMDIPKEDIAEYIYDAYINNKEVMIEKIKEII